ncbi:MAG: 2Fe-2S iron-sulfur cluster-binding protein [Pseudomonadota bacterium]|nr:2Fe-2S iron-sulfur cluster-binding protein [Pseudomonadota bacterium]
MEFADLERVVEAAVGSTLLEVCDAHGLPMETACGGFAACNSCRVRVIAGTLSPVEDVEEPFLDAPDQRLGCQARVVVDVTVRLDPGA